MATKPSIPITWESAGYDPAGHIAISVRSSERGTAPKMMKNDEEKLRWDLLPFEPVEDFVKILTYGAKKYKENNWKNGKSNADMERTFAAFMRHINSYRQGELIDPESGHPHLYHAFADLGFILYHYDTKRKLVRNWD